MEQINRTKTKKMQLTGTIFPFSWFMTSCLYKKKVKYRRIIVPNLLETFGKEKSKKLQSKNEKKNKN